MKYSAGNDPVYEASSVLVNYAGLTDQTALDSFELKCVGIRSSTLSKVRLSFTDSDLSVIHKHLFQDVYAWAGEYRSCSISKGGSLFASPAHIAGCVAKNLALISDHALKNISKADLADLLGHVVTELNAIHPFREGNGRAIRAHAFLVARRAGYHLDLSRILGPSWMKASIDGFAKAAIKPMSLLLKANMSHARERERSRVRR